MRSIVKYFIQYPITGNVMLVLLLVFGLISLSSLQTSFFPEQPSRTILIQTTYPGASPEEIEQGIVLKIEDELRGLVGVDRVLSNSNENFGVVTVELEQRTDIDVVLADVKNAVDRINSFPVGMEPPIVFKQEAVTPSISVAIHGDTDLKTLKEKARKAERELLAVDGLSQVTVSGFPEEEIVIDLEEDKLRAYGLSFAEVMNRVRSANLDLTGGTIRGAQEELLIRYWGKEYKGEELLDIVIRAGADGQIVRVGDIARVRDDWAETDQRSAYNGQPAVTLDIVNTNAEDILFITDTVKGYVAQWNKHESQVHASILEDASEVLRQRIDTLKTNGGQGFLLVLILLALFLHLRLAFWVALSIPIAFGGMFILAGFFGVTINVISLFGMIIVIGILVDDGIVISENIYRHYEMGKDRMTAAIDGTVEVLPAVFSAIVTTVIAFSSFFFITGLLGDFFAEMAFIVIATLIFSLVEGTFILPAHVAHSDALKPDAKPNAVQRVMFRFMDWMKLKLYEPVLRFSLKNKMLAFSIPVALLMISLGMVSGGFVVSTFFPNIERDAVNVRLNMPMGTRSHLTQEQIDYIEEAAWQVNEDVKATREDGLDIMLAMDKRVGTGGPHIGQLNIILLDTETRQMSAIEIADLIRKQAGDIPGAQSVAFGALGAFGMPVEVGLYGQDLDQVRLAADELVDSLRRLPALTDVFETDRPGQRELVIELKDKAYLLGLTVQDVVGQVRQGFFGGEIQRLQRGVDEVKVWVRYDEGDRNTLGQLRDMRIRTADGRAYPLSEIAELSVERGVIGFQRNAGRREIRVTADVADPDVSVSEVNGVVGARIIPNILSRYPGVSFGYEGQVREQGKAMGSIGTTMPVILLLMISVLILTFRSIWQTFAVLAIIPFSYIGVVWGHWALGLPISLFSILGVIALVGILINDSLVFVNAFNNLLREGKSFQDAVIEAGISRFRPIVLTSMTTIAGLAPLMLNKSFQAQFLIPMAAAVAFGLLVSTVIILLLLPVFLVAINDLKRFAQWFWNDRKVDPESVEPAVQEMREAGAFAAATGAGVTAMLLLVMLIGAPQQAAMAQSTDTLSLESAIDEALQSNYQLKIVRNQAEIASNTARPGTAGLLPSVVASGDLSYNNSTALVEFADPTIPAIDATGAATLNSAANIGVQYTLFDGLVSVRTFDQLKRNAALADVNVQAAAEATVLQVVAAYYTLALAQENLLTAQQSAAISQERFLRAENRREYGSGSELALLNARVDLNADSVRIWEAEVDIEQASRNLSQLLGRPVDGAIRVSPSIELAIDLQYDKLWSNLRQENKQLLAARMNLELAQLDKQIASGAYWPTLTGTAGYGYNRSSQDASFIELNRSYGFTGGLSLSLPIFTGTTRRMAVQNAEIGVINAELSNSDMERRLEADLQNAWAAYQNALRTASLQAEQVELAEQNFERSEERFKNGQLSGTAFREAQLNLSRAQYGLSASRVAAKLQETELARLAGTLQ